MEVFYKTDIGNIREVNEDYFYVSSKNENYELYILADGMGGYAGGEVASRMATENVVKYIESNFDITFLTDEDLLKLVGGAVEFANMIVNEKKIDESMYGQMGSTIEVLLVVKDRMYIAHAGDSRIYRMRNGKIRQLTKDHSYVQKLIDDGTIKEEESKLHPQRNKITKAVGIKKLVEPDVFVQRFIRFDKVIMCTDGLYEYIEKDEIKEIIERNTKNPEEELIKIAKSRGGSDNITLIIIKK